LPRPRLSLSLPERRAIALEEAEKQRQIDEDARIEQAKADAIKATEDRLKKIQDEMDAIARQNADAEEAAQILARNKELERQANKKHRAKVISEIETFLIESMGFSEENAEGLSDAFEKGSIPHMPNPINF